MKKILLLPFLALLFTSAFAQVPSYVATIDLICWYPFNSSAVNAANPGMLTGVITSAAPTTDRFGAANSAYWMDGDSANITLDSLFFDIGWPDYSISCWINSDTLDNPYNWNQAQTVINTIPHNGMAIYYNWGGVYGRHRVYAGSNPPGSGWDILAGLRVNTSAVTHAWKHFVLVKSGGLNYSFYVNGVLDTTFTTTTPAVSQYCKMVLGRSDPGVISEGFFGKIDDYGIWKRALTMCDIKKLYNASSYYYITSHPSSVAAGVGATITFSITDTGVGNTYQWQHNTGSGFTNLAAGAPYSGVTTPTLTITGVTSAMNGRKYRCVVNGALCADTSNFATLSLPNSLDNISGRGFITLQPNPTKDELFIAGISQPDIRIYNALGQLVRSADGANNVSVADLPRGLYLVKLIKDGALSYTGKVIKE